MKNKYSSHGFSVIEVVLAAAIFMLFSTAAIITLLQGFNTNRLGSEETVATQFATEGIEAVKSIKNQAYTNLVNSAGTGVIKVAGLEVWAFSGANNTLTHNSTDNYTRVIKVESVNRDGSGNIVSTGGTTDPDTKKITSTVNWNFNAARPESVVLSSYLSDWRKPITIGGPIMMVYSKTTNIPYYRTWNGSSWSAEGSATVVVGNINYIVLKSSRTRNEAILGTQTSTGAIYVQVWNGASWGSVTQVGTGPTTTRSFDIAYEKSSDKAIIVYAPTSGSADFAYRTWDGSLLSLPKTVTAPPTTGAINWIELAANPTSSSNEIAMIMFDANSDIYGMVWDGTSWDDMNSGGAEPVWDGTASTSTTKKAIAVAYEQTSGRAMFIWADSTSDNQSYRIWNGTSLTAATTLTIAASGGIGEWVNLVSRPNSNELLYGVQDALADINTRKWTGSAWDTVTQHPEHDGDIENITSMNFDLAWETHPTNPGEAWIMWGNGATVTARHWNGTGWDPAGALTGSDDTSFIRLKADPGSGVIFAGIYEDSSSVVGNRDILERRLTGGGTTWSAENIIWDGGTAGTPVYFRIDIATP